MSASLAVLAGMDAAALDRRWRQVFGTVPPSGLPPAQRARVIAYRLQALAYGDLDATPPRLSNGSSEHEMERAREEALRRSSYRCRTGAGTPPASCSRASGRG